MSRSECQREWGQQYEVWADREDIHLIPKTDRIKHEPFSTCWCQPFMTHVEGLERDKKSIVHRSKEDVTA